MAGKHSQRKRALATLRPVLALVVVIAMALSVAYQARQSHADDDDRSASDTPAQTEDAHGAPEAAPAQPQAVVQGTKLKMLPLVCTPKVVNESITAVSFNIKSRVTDVASILADSGADIVLLQEVDRNRASSRYADQAGLVADALGMTDAFGANVLRGRGSEYGTAVLSRYPIVSVENTLLPNAPGGQQRGLLHVVVNVRGVKLSIYDTHLQNRMEALRVRQMGTVAAIMREDPNPIILGGDFNATPRSQPVQIALSVLDDPWSYGVGVGSQLTHPSSHPRGRIDYLLHGGPGLTPTSTDVLTRTPSDHRAVRTSYELTGTHGEVCTRGKA